jgi:hypothetical protein
LNFLHKKTAKNCENRQRLSIRVFFYGTFVKFMTILLKRGLRKSLLSFYTSVNVYPSMDACWADPAWATGMTLLLQLPLLLAFLTAQRRYDMNGRFQMQGGKNWILPK